MSNQLQISGEAKIRAIQGPVVANSGVITALDGDASQYVRGDGTLADFPTSTGGGSSVSYYLNTSVSQGTIGGVAYKQLSKVPISGAGTDVTTSANGYIASYITDANDPALLEVPAGNFNCEFYFSVNSNAHNPYVYAEVYKYDGTTFTLLGSNVSIPQYLSNGTTLSPYYFAIAVSTAVLTVTDRIAIRIYVNVDTKTVTLHTENNHLCQVVTTFSKGLISLNNLTRQNQFFGTGTSGTDFAISSSVATHTFNLPVASASNTGKLSSTDWSTFNGKVPYTGATTNLNLGVYELLAQNAFLNGVSGVNGGNLFLRQDVDFGQSAGYTTLYSTGKNLGFVSYVGSFTYNALFSLNSLTNNTTRTYTLPDATGTLALTSDLSSYVPYTGATANVDLGIYNLTAAGVTANSFNAIGSGVQGGYLYLKKGSSPFNVLVGSNSITAEDSKFILMSDAGSSNYKLANIDIGLLTNNTARTFTLPDLSGTLALLEGTQTFSGLKSFSNSIQAEYGISLYNGILTGALVDSTHTGFYAAKSGTYTNITFAHDGAPYFSRLKLLNNATYDYTFPAASGTIALTSDLGAYVTLATAQDISGNKTFTALATKVEALGIKLTSGVVSTTGYLTLNTKVVGTLHSLILSPDSATNIAEFTFDNSAIRTYALQNASGTIALLSGTQTFAGATTFSSNITVNSVQIGSAGNTTNIKLGDSTFGAITTGSNNIAIGSSALTSITTSNANIGIGNSALASVVDGAFNTAIGFGIGGSITSGSNNALFGYGAGSAITTGNYNTILGAYAGTAGMSNNIVLADGAGNIRYQWNGTNNVFGNPISGTSATFSSSVTALASTTNGFIAQTTANSVYPYFRWVANNRSYWAAAIDNGSDAPFSIGNGNTVGSSILFTLTPSNNTAYFAGSVGIGTSLPDLTLSINGAMNLRNSTRAGAFEIDSSGNLWMGTATTLGNLYFETGHSTTGLPSTGTPRMTITGSGNVGIGTSDPTNKLQVVGHGTANSLMTQSIARFVSSNGFNLGSDGTNALIGVNNSGTSMVFLRRDAGEYYEAMRISSAGRTTIKGSTANSSEYALVVENSTPANMFYVRNDGFILTGNISASPYNNSTTGRTMVIESSGGLGYLVSTRESKANIESIKSIDFINQLNPVSFNYRKKDKDTNTFTDELYDNTTYGFVADEVEKVNKELVFYNEDGSLAGVEYNSIIAILTKAVQELKAEIEQLKNK